MSLSKTKPELGLWVCEANEPICKDECIDSDDTLCYIYFYQVRILFAFRKGDPNRVKCIAWPSFMHLAFFACILVRSPPKIIFTCLNSKAFLDNYGPPLAVVVEGVYILYSSHRIRTLTTTLLRFFFWLRM